MTFLFSKLLISHFVGDFILLSHLELKQKGKALWKSQWLGLHSIIHFVLALIAIFDIAYWWVALAIGISHYLVKVSLSTLLDKRQQWLFVIEQLLHGIIIFFAAAYVYIDSSNEPPLRIISIAVHWEYVAGLIAVSFPAAKIIEVFLSQWPPTKHADKIKGLVNAGLWIGILERILIYIFIVTNHWEGIGFLLAAKSVFRFGDLTNSKDISLTEYIMVGTFLSFCLAIGAGLLTNYFLS